MRKMFEISGIPVAQDENCTDIVYKLCQITSTDTKKLILKSHRTKNGDIIVKFKDRPQGQTWYSIC